MPEELIAQEPIYDRKKSRLLFLDKQTGNIEHTIFENIIDYFQPGDCLVLNDSKVIPARLIGRRHDTGGKIELILLKTVAPDTWEVLGKPGRRAKKGSKIIFGNGELSAIV
ncbi:MAG: S-adenosylmethionine:tRNA ribosyltransferase-isomerase, partial [Thermoanaerobacterales bacterium]|nr:S-adenosylmethionine:tRNA ribosyltransferase-isomerase [Thermoanaerobacterales bacterium]